eukprot:3477121-Ditylum_brightwellii.AAC.1
MIGVHQGDNLAPPLFNLFFQAALESLETAWELENIPVLKFQWFLTSRNGCLNSCLHQQGKAQGSEFRLKKSLYVDAGAFLFKSCKDLERGANLIFSHFKHFGLTMHFKVNNKPSKTEAVVFIAPDKSFTDYDAYRLPVTH